MTTIFARRAVLPGPRVGCARVTITGRDITSVEEDVEPQPDDDDVGDLLLAPAFVDIHTHVALVSLRGSPNVQKSAGENLVEDLFFRVERHLTPEDVHALATVGAIECLLHGTAFISDHYYFAGEVARAMAEVGMTGIVAPTLQDVDGPGVGRAEAALAETDAIRQSSALYDAGIAAALGPHATDTVSDALWDKIGSLADAWNLPVHVHVGQSWDEADRAWRRAATSPVGLLRRHDLLDRGPGWALVHALYVHDADLAALDPKRHLLVACPSSQAQFGFPAPVQRWDAAGLAWAVATDCAASNDSMNVAKELRAVANLRTAHVVHAPAYARWCAEGTAAAARAVREVRDEDWERSDWMGDPRQLLRHVWDIPGRLHPALPVGQLAPGQLANLALWDLNHPCCWPGTDPLRALAYSDCSLALQQLMTAGRWLTPRGTHQATLGGGVWRDARREADQRLRRLLER